MPYLGALIESIVEVYFDNVRIIVSYADMTQSVIESAKQKAPLVTFYPSKHDFSGEGDIIKKVSSKSKMWEELMGLSTSGHNTLLDSDMIVLKKIDRFFDEDFDVAYTYKTDEDENLSWPLNTGAMLAKRSPAALGFFKEWDRMNCDILGDDIRSGRACSKWGGVDQATLGEMLKMKQGGVKFHGFPCKYLNETRCIPVTADTHIIHYKMRWRPVLPEGNFTKYRPKEKCLKMFRIWRNFYERWAKR